MKVRLTASAEADLEAIGDYLAQIDPERARLTIRALRATTMSIGATPKLWSPVIPSRSVRKKTMHPYILLYVIREGEVLILRIAHERSDWTSLV